ncbi:MAG: BMC domain-containing protein [Planctomycetota bacterium]|jgi:microcompartment protein CcmL/EutN|nr:MAG: BMC domain-containing protein [Planctomycetota bacterium]
MASSLTDQSAWGPGNENGFPSIGILETNGWTAGMVACDAMAKSANVSVIQVEWNDMLGAVLKIFGSPSDVQSAIEAGASAAKSMQQYRSSHFIHSPDRDALRAILSPPEFNALIEQAVVKQPLSESEIMSNANGQALGFIETQGFTAVFEAIDTACKAASVDVIGKEKLGGGYVTVVIRGDVAAVSAAIEAAKPKVEGLGKLIACHVIARPSTAALGLLPK